MRWLAATVTLCLAACIPDKEAETRSYNFRKPVELSACTSTEYLDNLLQRIMTADYLSAQAAANQFSRTNACPKLRPISSLSASVVAQDKSDSGVIFHLVSYKVSSSDLKYYSWLVNRNGLSEENWEQFTDVIMTRRAEGLLLDGLKELFK